MCDGISAMAMMECSRASLVSAMIASPCHATLDVYFVCSGSAESAAYVHYVHSGQFYGSQILLDTINTDLAVSCAFVVKAILT